MAPACRGTPCAPHNENRHPPCPCVCLSNTSIGQAPPSFTQRMENVVMLLLPSETSSSSCPRKDAASTAGNRLLFFLGTVASRATHCFGHCVCPAIACALANTSDCFAWKLLGPSLGALECRSFSFFPTRRLPKRRACASCVFWEDPIQNPRHTAIPQTQAMPTLPTSTPSTHTHT